MQGLPTLLLHWDDGRWCWIYHHMGCWKRSSALKRGERGIHGYAILHGRHIAVILGVETLARDRLKSTPVHIYASIHHSVRKKNTHHQFTCLSFSTNRHQNEKMVIQTNTLSLCVCVMSKSHMFNQSLTWWIYMRGIITTSLQQRMHLRYQDIHFGRSTAFHIH